MSVWKVRHREETASTNDDIRQAAEEGAAAGLVICADLQTKGRGRLGRNWASPPGNLYCSVLLRPPLEVQHYPHYSFAAALAIADMVDGFLGRAAARLKWPNDVLVDGGKISGILLEAGQGYLVVGMGVNLRHHPDGGLYPATSLAALGVEPRNGLRDDALKAVLERLRFWCDALERAGFEALRDAWCARRLEGRLLVQSIQGPVEGAFADLDLEGRLSLQLNDGSTKVFSTGDVAVLAGRLDFQGGGV